MIFPALNSIELAREGRVLTVAFNRPERLNAFDREMHSELVAALIFGAADEASDLIILTGRGRAFSAGGDLDWQQDACDDPSLFELTIREAKQIVFALLDCEKPIIARINGPAVGFGATLALFCDIAVMARSAYISDPHVKVGMVAGDGAAVIWPQLIGFARAKEYLLIGDKIDAEEAERIGLVNRAVDDDMLDPVVADYVDRLLANPRLAVRYSKLTINVALRQLASSIMDVGLAYEAMTNASGEHRDALAAWRSAKETKRGRKQ